MARVKFLSSFEVVPCLEVEVWKKKRFWVPFHKRM